MDGYVGVTWNYTMLEANEELIIDRIYAIPTLLVTRQSRSVLLLRLRVHRIAVGLFNIKAKKT